MAHMVNAADSAAQQLVLVYGSLKQGMTNHHQLAGAALMGTARLNGLALYDLGPFPMAIASGNPAHILHGEVYGLDGPLLAALDRFEGAPRLYERQRWQLVDGRCVWIYVGQPRQVRHVRRISSGIWSGPARRRGCW